MNHEFIDALEQVEKEKGISKEILLDAIETALASAYKRDQKATLSIEVRIDSETGAFHVFTHKTVVEEVEDEKNEISLEEAQKINPIYELNDLVEFEIFPKEFGRIAAQTAKQVVVQRIREAERSIIYDEFSTRVGDLITGIVQRFEQRALYVDLGRIEGVLPANEQMPNEQYEPGTRLKTYIVEVKKTTKGPQIILSRARTGLVKRLFELEVPEIQDGLVEIKSVAREPGYRSKVAVHSRDPQIDPVGACVGARGIRVQMIVRELKGEKIDVVPWSADPIQFIINALSPAKVSDVKILPSKNTAIVIVPNFQLSLAIGKEGQNARLAAKLTGWKIDIKSETQAEERREEIEQLIREEIGFRDVVEVTKVLDNGAAEPESLPETESGYQPETAEIIEETALNAEEEQSDNDLGEDEDIFSKKKPKKVKSLQKQRNRIVLDEEPMDDEAGYFFTDVLEKSEVKDKENSAGAKTGLDQPEPGNFSGFNIGQLLGEELLKKAKKGAKKGDK